MLATEMSATTIYTGIRGKKRTWRRPVIPGRERRKLVTGGLLLTAQVAGPQLLHALIQAKFRQAICVLRRQARSRRAHRQRRIMSTPIKAETSTVKLMADGKRMTVSSGTMCLQAAAATPAQHPPARIHRTGPRPGVPGSPAHTSSLNPVITMAQAWTGRVIHGNGPVPAAASTGRRDRAEVVRAGARIFTW